MTAGTSFALTEYWRTIGSGKASRTRRARGVERREVGDVDRRAEAAGGGARATPSRLGLSPGPTSRDERPTIEIRTIAADDGRDDRVEVEQVGREAADREA